MHTNTNRTIRGRMYSVDTDAGILLVMEISRAVVVFSKDSRSKGV
jgi:hypothetical protein